MNRTVTAAAILTIFAIPGAAQEQALLNQYCITCHNQKIKTAGLMLDKLDFPHPGPNRRSGRKWSGRFVRA
jgi:hypothetical protein